MPPGKPLILTEVLAIAALPFAMKAVLVIIARIWKTNLRPTLPWLHTLRWALWVIGMPFVLLAVLRKSHVKFLYFAFGMALISSSTGFGIVEGWVKRKYAPELVPPESPDGWWPSPRN
jgi:hypothetical protein